MLDGEWNSTSNVSFTLVNRSLVHDGCPYHIETESILCKSMDWFLYDRDLRHERVNDWILEDYTSAQKGK